MDTTQAGSATEVRDLRVREQARDALAVMAFSATASAVMALALVALGTLGG